ncbi:MAG: hypothetical protein IKO84_06775 [Butyrivibrio sp.]|nr:hypothetical protein [Butyrivibrio sp.]
MGLFNKNKNEDQIIKRLSQNAGGIIEMLKAAFMTPNGVDIRPCDMFPWTVHVETVVLLTKTSVSAG